VAGGFLRTSPGKQRTVENRELRSSGWVRNGNGEEARILVIYVAEFDATMWSKGHKPPSLPVEKVPRFGQGDPWASGRKCRVSHQVALERFHERDTRILATTAAVRPPLIIGFRLECHADPLDAGRVAGFIESHSCDPNARVIVSRCQPREQVELTVWAASGSRIQDTFDLLGVPRLWFHHQPQALHLKSTHQGPSQGHAS
jgi:hypothetical protein